VTEPSSGALRHLLPVGEGEQQIWGLRSQRCERAVKDRRWSRVVAGRHSPAGAGSRAAQDLNRHGSPPAQMVSPVRNTSGSEQPLRHRMCRRIRRRAPVWQTRRGSAAAVCRRPRQDARLCTGFETATNVGIARCRRVRQESGSRNSVRRRRTRRAGSSSEG